MNNNIKLMVKNLNFYYGDNHALKDLNADFPSFNVSAIIGPSGSGKSTFLRCLNCIYALYPNQRTTGDILLDGKNILAENLQELRAKIGMVFQKPTPFPMSIFDNVAFGVKLHASFTRQQLADRVHGALQQAGLWDEVKDKLKSSGLSLSGGQQQRLCIARAIAVKPQILLLDEPTSSLDPRATEKIETLITELKNEFTIIIVTHNMQQAARISDYTTFMNLGSIIETNTTQQIFSQAKEQVTQHYIAGKFG